MAHQHRRHPLLRPLTVSHQRRPDPDQVPPAPGDPPAAGRGGRPALPRSRSVGSRGRLPRPSRTPPPIFFFEVPIPRWLGPAAGVTLDMTAGSLPPLWLRLPGSCTFQLPVTHDISQEALTVTRSRPLHSDQSWTLRAAAPLPALAGQRDPVRLPGSHPPRPQVLPFPPL